MFLKTNTSSKYSVWQMFKLTVLGAFVLVMSNGISAQSCSPSEVAHWNLNTCYAGSLYDEFTPQVNKPSGFQTLTASIFSNQGQHSCTPRGNNVGVCHAIRNNCSWADNDPNAYRFSVTMNPSSGKKVTLTGMNFMEAAPHSYSWTNGGSGDNDPPSKYGIRVLKNGVEIYQQTGINTSSGWSTESFDFTNDPDFTVTSQAKFDFELLGYCRQGSSGYAVWDVDEVKVYACSENVAPPTVFAAPSPVCNGNSFLWSQTIDPVDGSVDKVRFVCGNTTSYTIPGAYPAAFNGPVNIEITDAVSYDGYANRVNASQSNERWRVVFKKNGNTVYASSYTQDLQDNVVQASRRSNLGSAAIQGGFDEIVLEHWKVANDANCSNGPNSVVPSSICINYSPIAPPPSLTISDVTVNEDGGSASVQICASAPVSGNVTFDYTTTNGTASAGTDYTSASASATISNGQTCTTVSVPILDDNADEPNEIFNINLSNPSGATIADPDGTVTILDNDDPIPTEDCTLVGIVAGQGKITINGVNANDIFSIQVFDATWNTVFNEYYTNNPGSVMVPNLPAGTYFVKTQKLTSTWSEVCKKEAFVTVTGAPVMPSLTINDITVNENAGTASLQICASATSSSPISVRYTTSNNTAMAGIDYGSVSAITTIPAGQLCVSVTVSITDDATNEPTEEFFVNLSDTPAGVTISDPIGSVTILDNDDVPVTPSLTINDVTVNEDAGTATLQICASSVSNSPITVRYTTSNNSAMAGIDYNSVSAIATIQPGQTCATVSVAIIDDNFGEPTEDFFVNLSQANGATIADPVGSVTILDNGGTGNPDCNAITFDGSGGKITVTGVVAPVALVQVFDAAWNTVFNETYMTSPGMVIVPNLANGQYYVKVDLLTAQWTSVCKKEEFVTVGNGGGQPSISINDVTVNENAGTATLDVCLSAASSNNVIFAFATADGTAIFQGDYAGNAGSATIAAGQTCTQITVGITDDGTNEPTEVFNVNLSGIQGATPGDVNGTVTILDDDSVPVLPSLSINDITVNEDVGAAEVMVCLSAPSASPVSFTVFPTDGTAVSQGDYLGFTSTETIPAGQTCITVPFPIFDGTNPEPTEFFNTVISQPVGATIGDGAGTVTILDNDQPGADCNAITFDGSNGKITVTGVVAPVAMVQVFDASWNTIFNETYMTSPGMVMTPNLGNGQYYVKVDLLTAQWSSICKKEEFVTVGGGGPIPALTINDITVNEQAGVANVSVCASSVSSTPILVNYISSNGSAIAGSDYTSSSGTVTIPANTACGILSIPITNDNTNEPTESFNINLSSPNGATIADPVGTVTILDDDSAPIPSLTINDITVNENVGTATLQICASSAPTSNVTVQYSTSNGTAGSGSDYNATSGTATIMAGMTCTSVTLPIVDDNTNEPTEVFDVNLSNPSGATIADPVGTVTILDNDNAPDPCAAVSFTPSQGKITANGVSSPVALVQAFDGSWNQVFNEIYTNSPGMVMIPNLTSGTYYVKVDLLDASWQSICKKEEFVTVVGAPVTPSITINDVTVNEDAGTASLQICASETNAAPMTVQYATASGTATMGADFMGANGTATIPAGQTCTTVTVPILDDNTDEPNETFVVNLTNPSNATIADPQGTVTILDDDVPPPTGVLTFPQPADVTETADPGQNTKVVNYPTPTATTTCTVGSVTMQRISGPASGSAFPVGSTEVCYRATDQCGNQIDRCFDVVVNAGGPVCNVTRTVSNSKISCGTGDDYGMYFSSAWPGGSSDSRRFTLQNATFVENADGTAKLTATAVNNELSNVRFSVDIDYCGRTFNQPAGSPKGSSCYTVNANGWYYYTTMCGTLTGTNGASGTVIEITRTGEAFQVGTGANLNEQNKFGASAWFDMIVTANSTNSSLSFVHGDFNICLSGTPTAPACGTGTANCNSVACYTPPAFPNPNTCYVIRNASSNKVLDAEQSNWLQQYNNDGTSSTKWKFQPAGGNYFYIVSQYTGNPGRVIDIENGSTSNGARADLIQPNGEDCTKYRLQDAGNGRYYIVAKHSGKALKLMSNPGSNGTGIYQQPINSSYTHQKWYIDASSCPTSPLVAENNALSLNAQRVDSQVKLIWSNNTGDINKDFVVERSSNQFDWTKIMTVDASGPAAEMMYFQEYDATPAQGENFYRIKLMYKDGSVRYSDIKSVLMPDFKSFNVFPNPARDFVSLDLTTLDVSADATVQIYNQLGRLVKTTQVTANSRLFGLDISELNNGFYTVQIITNNGTRRSAKLMVETNK